MSGRDVAESNIVDRHIRSLRIKLQNDYWLTADGVVRTRRRRDDNKS